MGEILNSCFGRLANRYVVENSDVMADPIFGVAQRRDAQPLGVNLAVFAAIPDFALPVPQLLQRGPHLPIKIPVVAAGRQQSRISSADFLQRITGHLGKGAVDHQDAVVAVADQNTLGALLVNGGGQPEFLFGAQPLILALEIIEGERNIGRHLVEQIDQFGIEELRLGSVQAERADHLAAPLQRKRGARAHAGGRHQRLPVGLIVLAVQQIVAYPMRAAGQHPARRLVRQRRALSDRFPQRNQPAAQIAEGRHHLRLLGVRLRKADPGPFEFTALHRDPTDFLEQPVVAVVVAQNGLIGQAQRRVEPGDASQALLDAFAGRDVVDHHDEVFGLPVGVAQQRNRETGPDDAAIPVDVTFFHRVGLDLIRQHLPHQPDILFQILGMGDVMKGLLQQLLARVADHGAQAVVDQQPAAVGRDMRHPDRRLLEGGAKAALLGDQGHFRALALGNIADHRLEIALPLVADGPSADLDGERAAVKPPVRALEHGAAGFGHPAVVVRQGIPRVGKTQLPHMAAPQRLGGAAVVFSNAVVHLDDRAILGQQHHHIQGLPEQGFVTLAQVGPFQVDAEALQHEAGSGVPPPKQNAGRAGHQSEQRHEPHPGQQAGADRRLAKVPEHFPVGEHSRNHGQQHQQ